MKYIQKFESHKRYTMEGLAKLNEAEVSQAFQDSMGSMLGSKVTDKDTATLKKELREKLSSVQEQYKGSLKEYLAKQFDKGWFSELLDTAVAPGKGLLSVTGGIGGKTDAVKAREEAAAKAKEQKPADLLTNATLKAVVLAGLPEGTELKEGLKDVQPNSDNLADIMYETSMDTASKLFAAATQGLDNLDEINFDFETLDKKISQNEESINKAKEEIKALEDSNDEKAWNQMLEMYCIVNCLRSQQCALLAAKAEYEFLSGTFEATFIGKIEAYVTVLIEAAVSVFAAIICAKFISSLGKTEFIADVKKAVSDAGPTIIQNFQQGVNEVMASINPITKNPLFLGAVIAAYVLFKGGELADKLEFEEKEKYMILALEQFVPTIAAVNSSLAVCESSFKNIQETINGPDWGAAIEDYVNQYENLSEKDKQKQVEKLKDERADDFLMNFNMELTSPDNVLNLAVQNMKVSDAVKKTLTPDAIRSGKERGETAMSNLLGDWFSSIENIFEPMEQQITDDFEDGVVDEYASYVRKENPAQAAIGGLIFIAQSNAILKDPSKYFIATKYKTPELVKAIELPKVEVPLQIEAPKIEPLPPVIDLSDPDVESCGIFVSFLDKDKNVYKSLLGKMYFESGSPKIMTEKGTDGIDVFQQLLDDYKFNFIVLGNADVTGPQEQQKGKRFIGNKALSEVRANAFINAIKVPEGTKTESLGFGKKFARNYTDYIDSNLGGRDIAKKLKIDSKDKAKMSEFKKNLANDRRMEIVILPPDEAIDTVKSDEATLKKICLKQIKDDDARLVLKYQGDTKRFISKAAKDKYNMDFPKRESVKKEEKKVEANNENNKRYILPFNSFLG